MSTKIIKPIIKGRAKTLENLTVYPSGTNQEITAADGKGYKKVTVPAVSSEELTVTGNGVYTPPQGKLYSKVTVALDWNDIAFTLSITAVNCTVTAYTDSRGERVTLVNGSRIYIGDVIYWTSTAAAGYKHPDQGATSRSGYFTVSSGNTSIVEEYTDLDVFSVNTSGLLHVTISETGSTANKASATAGSNYTILITPQTGYKQLNKSDITVTIGGNAYTDFDFVYSLATTYQLTIPGEDITGSIVISGTAELADYTLTISAGNCTVTASVYRNGATTALSDGDTIYYGETVNWFATANAGYNDGGVTSKSGVITVDGNETISASFVQHTVYTVSTDNVAGFDITDDGVPTTAATNGTDFSIRFTPESGRRQIAKGDITVTIGGNAYTGFSYDYYTATTYKLTIPGEDITGNIVITATALYAVTVNNSHVSITQNASGIASDGSATLIFAAVTGYGLPDSVTVTGAELDSWNKTTGYLEISNPTGAVTITISGKAFCEYTQSGTAVTITSAQYTQSGTEVTIE